MQIDHVIYAAHDLDTAADGVESDLGLTVVPGGRHAGHGTHNRIVPLGRGYLELMGIADDDEAAASPIGRALRRHLDERGDGLFAWAVAVREIEPVADRLGLPVTKIAREGLTAQLVGVAEALGAPGLPFFIARDHGIPDPRVGADAGGIGWVEVSCDEAKWTVVSEARSFR